MELDFKKLSKNALAFQEGLEEGLSAEPKTISSRFFYNEKGDELFQKIMNLEEYYLTDCEFEIFNRQKESILDAISPNKEAFNLIELGAGDGSKTKVLIDYFLEKGIEFNYYPVDISKHILDLLELDLKENFPSLNVFPVNKEYFAALNNLKEMNNKKNVVLFLGSNIGNFDQQTLNDFFQAFSTSSKKGDQLLIGVDLRKDAKVILHAYSDKEGVTAKFNLNLLERANQELGANFNLDDFKHYATYNPENGEARSYLVSMKKQTVRIESLNKSFSFLEDEFINTEISKKYDLDELDKLAKNYTFSVDQHFTDSKNYFVDTLWTKK
jgi:dimethylhistidine N-methyltransferase